MNVDLFFLQETQLSSGERSCNRDDVERVVLKKQIRKKWCLPECTCSHLVLSANIFLFLHIFCFLEMHMLITLVLSI